MIGELNIHKYNCKDGQAKPSFLDMAEVIIASCPGQTGIKKNAIFEVRKIIMHVNSSCSNCFLLETAEGLLRILDRR